MTAQGRYTPRTACSARPVEHAPERGALPAPGRGKGLRGHCRMPPYRPRRATGGQATIADPGRNGPARSIQPLRITATRSTLGFAERSAPTYPSLCCGFGAGCWLLMLAPCAGPRLELLRLAPSGWPRSKRRARWRDRMSSQLSPRRGQNGNGAGLIIPLPFWREGKDSPSGCAARMAKPRR